MRSAAFGIAAEFAVIGLVDRPLPADVETLIYRVAQEALTNVFQHAHAQHVSVLLSVRDQQLQLVVEDDGQGFDRKRLQAHEDMDSQGQLGLLEMRERVVAIGGTMEIEAEPGSGTPVYVRVPLPTSVR